MKRLFLPLIIIICVAPILMQCEKQENIDDLKEIQWTTYTKLDGLAGNSVESIAIDKEGNKWFGTDGGVSKFDGNAWTNYMISDGISLNNVYRIAGDKKGNMWFGNSEGLSKFDGKKWTNYRFSNYTISDRDDRVYNRLVDFAIDGQDIYGY